MTARLTVVDRFGRTDSEAERFYPFEVVRSSGSFWFFIDLAGTFRKFEFFTRQGLDLTGSLSWKDPGGTGVVRSFAARLSGERDILIVPRGSGIEFRGHIELGPSQWRMMLTQTGGPDHGRVWTLLYDDGPG